MPIPITIFKLQLIEKKPDVMENGIVYYSREYGVAFHLCACGCGELVVTPCNEIQRTPTEWLIDVNSRSLSPSIGSFQLPCKSHYFITNGTVRWCK